MKNVAVLVLLILMSCKDTSTTNEIIKPEIVPNVAQLEADRQFEVYDYDGLAPLLNKTDGKVHIVNFWATWCAPCIKELPYFEAVNEKYKDKGVELLLVSLDFPNKYDTALQPFIEKNNLKAKVVALDDVDQNRWIPAIAEEWSGAIPATIIYNNDKRQFYEKSFTQQELETELKQFLK